MPLRSPASQCRVKAPVVVFYRDDQRLIFTVNTQEQFAGIRMFDRIVQRPFTANNKLRRTTGRRHRPGSSAPRPAGSGWPSGREKSARFADVVHKIEQCVTPGIDGPEPARVLVKRVCVPNSLAEKILVASGSKLAATLHRFGLTFQLFVCAFAHLPAAG